MKSGLSPLSKLSAHKYVLLEFIPEARSVLVAGRENAEIVPAFAETTRNTQIMIGDKLRKYNEIVIICDA